MFWNRTITLYNKSEDELTGEIKWHRHLLKNCFFKSRHNKVNIGNAQSQSDSSIVRIPQQVYYLSPNKWGTLADEEKIDFFTLQIGDLIFFDEINDDINEYVPGQRSTDIVEKYKSSGSLIVNFISINDFIDGEHYLVRGE